MIDIIFYIFAFFIILSALGTVFTRNPIYAVLFLIFTFLNSAGIFVLLNAEFLAFAIILVYIGALAIIFLFIVMLVNIKASIGKKGSIKFFITSLTLIVIFTGEVIFLLVNSFNKTLNLNVALNKEANLNSLEKLGFALYNNYYYIFLVVGIILTLTAIGVLLISKIDNNINNNYKQSMFKQANKSSASSVTLLKTNSKEGLK
jgi:NADH-quinone oxidoreductase subunit J